MKSDSICSYAAAPNGCAATPAIIQKNLNYEANNEQVL